MCLSDPVGNIEDMEEAGNKVRELKNQNATKSEINAAVQYLLLIKHIIAFYENENNIQKSKI